MQKTYAVDPCVSTVNHDPHLNLDRTELITATRAQLCAKCRLGGNSNSVSKSSMSSLGRTPPRKRCQERQAVHSPFTADATTPSKMSFTTSWAPSSVPTHTPDMSTGCFQGRERKEDEVMATAFWSPALQGSRANVLPPPVSASTETNPALSSPPS